MLHLPWPSLTAPGKFHGILLRTAKILSIGVLMSGVASAQGQSPAAPKATFKLAASERVIDEGEVVQFVINDKEYWSADGTPMRFEADLSPVEWDFGDGRQDPASAYGLYDMKHWFVDDKEGPFVVKATHQGNTEQIRITVNDVLPVILGVSVTENPRKDSPVTFQAAVWDPGFEDDLEFTWDFGEGGTATGPNARHTWSATGIHEVELSVKDVDRDDAPQTFKFHVTVGDEQYFQDNEFSAFGDISGTANEIDGLVLVGSTGNVTERNVEGRCQIRIEMRSSEADMGVVLTAHLYPGLAPGTYSIGETKEWGGSHAQDVASRGTFFAEFIPPLEKQYRMAGGKKIGGPFWSDRGTVTVRKFEAGELELTFDAVFTENIPATVDQPRQVAVLGALVTVVPTAVTAADITDPSDAPDIPGLDILARSVLVTDLDDSREARNAIGVKHYSCASEEPEEFEVVASKPVANEVNLNFEAIKPSVEFSKSVDPDSIVHPDTTEDNLELLVLSNDGYRRVVGSWMPSKQNPRVVEFFPQSRLLPGAVHCVFIGGGEKGVRSFTGSVLVESSLEALRGQMAQACTTRDGDFFLSHAFSTRVEIESVGVSLYQQSLLGPHAPLIRDSIYGGIISRVYPWWQDASRKLHPSAAVREFDARIFTVVNRQRMEPLISSEMRLKRPDLYFSEERRNGLHSIEFITSDDIGSGAVDYFSVVQPLNSNGAPVDPVDPGQIRQIGTTTGLVLNVGFLQLEGNCVNESSPEDCGGGFLEVMDMDQISRFILPNWIAYDLPISDISQTHYVETFDITPACPGGVLNGSCFDAFQAQAESEEGFGPWRQQLANQIAGNPYLFESPNVFEENLPDFDVLLVALPSRMISLSLVEEHRQAQHGTPILFFQQEVDKTAFRRAMVQALLQDQACDFSGESSCDHAPIQSYIPLFRGLNLHHAEVGQHGVPLIPLLKGAHSDENPSSHWISTYNFARLYEALGRD